MADQTAREKILQRVLNLRAKAEADGASEHEMNTAFAMAMKLMAAYQIEEAELALAEAEGRIELEIINRVADTSALGNKQRHKVILTLSAVAEFTSTRVVYNSYNGNITFTGHRPDVELANYLVAVVKEAIDREYHNYRVATPAVGRGAKSAFQQAMAYRISNRLYRMARESAQEIKEKKMQAERLRIENKDTASSTALVVAEMVEQKRKGVEELFKKTHTRLRAGSGFRMSGNGNAYSAGSQAGDRVNLGRAISSANQKAIA